MKRWMWVVTAVLLLLIAGYIVAGIVVRKRIASALRQLPPGVSVSYSDLHVRLLSASLTFDDLVVRRTSPSPAGGITVHRLEIGGINYAAALHRRFAARSVVAEDASGDFGDLTFEGGSGEVDDVSTDGSGGPDPVGMEDGKMRVGGVRFSTAHITYTPPGADERVRICGLQLDSKNHSLRIDTVRIRNTVGKEEIGRAKGHQVDVVEAASEGVAIEGLDVMGLLRQRLVADRIVIRRNDIYVFRDRRLPLAPGEKPMPMEGLESLPVTLRVGSVSLGTTFFAYEEHPVRGKETGMLKIYRLHGTLEPLINHPRAGDPAYLTMRMEGSLMNSGTVTATTRMPLHKGDPYQVEGAFHELDVTSLNDPAENLGRLRLESGMLNSLDFQFVMTDEASTGRIIGEYHDLVVDKLKEKTDEKKVDKLKSFALKKFIIPKNKDKSLAVRKRTGKVKYKRDKERYFSYYLLHSLLVGVKSSFTLGFLLPG